MFPKVLVVLGGRLNPSQLVRRRTTFLQLADQAGVAESITAMVTTLPELEAYGPFSPIFWTVGSDAKAVDFAGEVPDPGVPTGPVDVNGRRGRQLRLVEPEPLQQTPRRGR